MKSAREMPSDRPLVVMMVTFADDLGGAERSMLSLAEHLPALQIAPVLVCRPGPFAESASAAGLRVLRQPLSRPLRISRKDERGKRYSAGATLSRGKRSLTDAMTLRRAAKDCGADLIYSNSLPSHLSTAMAGSLARRPVLWHLREIVEPGPGRTALSTVGRLAAGLIAISDAVAGSVSHPRVVTVYNPVAEPPSQTQTPSWLIDRPRVGYLGRIDPRKGIEDLIGAAGRIDAQVVIVGDLTSAPAEYVSELRAQADGAAQGRVHFVGKVDDPWSALSELDVLVVPSLAEPFGRVAAEGQRAGVPVVVADAGGLPEIVTDGVDGLRYPPGDTPALAAAVNSLLGDPELCSRLAKRGLETAHRFDPSKHAVAMSKIFRVTSSGG